MRLLVVTNDFPPTVGGIENYTYSLVRRWPPGDVIVVTRAVPGAEEFDAGQKFRIVRRESSTLLPSRDLADSLLSLIAQESIDVVHFPSSLPLGLMGRSLGRPYVLSVHGGEYRLASRLPAVRTLLKRVSAGAGLIIAESSFAAKLVRDFMGDGPALRTITCGVDVDRYGKDVAPAVEVGDGGPVVLSVSRLVARKGPRTLVGCFPSVLARYPDAHLVIVGGGPDLEPLKKKAAQLHIEQSVTFTGPQPWDRISSYLSAATIFALPTRSRFLGTETEGLPLVYVEAAAAGLPLIGGRAGGVTDAVREGETGLLVSNGDSAETAAAILRLLDDPALAARMGKAARKMAEEEFEWDALAEKYRQALEELAVTGGQKD